MFIWRSVSVIWTVFRAALVALICGIVNTVGCFSSVASFGVKLTSAVSARCYQRQLDHTEATVASNCVPTGRSNVFGAAVGQTCRVCWYTSKPQPEFDVP